MLCWWIERRSRRCVHLPRSHHARADLDAAAAITGADLEGKRGFLRHRCALQLVCAPPAHEQARLPRRLRALRTALVQQTARTIHHRRPRVLPARQHPVRWPADGGMLHHPVWRQSSRVRLPCLHPPHLSRLQLLGTVALVQHQQRVLAGKSGRMRCLQPGVGLRLPVTCHRGAVHQRPRPSDLLRVHLLLLSVCAAEEAPERRCSPR